MTVILGLGNGYGWLEEALETIRNLDRDDIEIHERKVDRWEQACEAVLELDPDVLVIDHVLSRTTADQCLMAVLELKSEGIDYRIREDAIVMVLCEQSINDGERDIYDDLGVQVIFKQVTAEEIRRSFRLLAEHSIAEAASWRRFFEENAEGMFTGPSH